jgi:hypothetical protein
MTIPHYHVDRTERGWRVTRVDEPCAIASAGTVKSRAEAVAMARLLAGWQGKATATNGKGKPLSVWMYARPLA